MGWLNVPTLLHRLTSGLVDGESLGYLSGTGDDAGWRLFLQGSSYVIAQTFEPTFTVGDGTYLLTGLLYNGAPVWESSGMFIFTSSSLGARILKQGLSEPYFVEKIDETTGNHYIDSGDAYWLAPDSPSVGDTGLVFEAAGTAQQNLEGSYDWPYYARVQTYENRTNNAAPYLGLYKRADTNTEEYRVVGSPCFEVVSGPSGFSGEIFAREALRDAGGRAVYAGTGGHSIRYDSWRERWCIGTPSDSEGAKWWESESPPVTPDVLTSRWASDRRIAFAGMVADGNGGVSGNGTEIRIRLRGFANAGAVESVLVGEAEVWR